jgi:hypothetical protein
MTGILMVLSDAGVLLINAGSSLAEAVNVSFTHPENDTDASLQNDETAAPKASRNTTQFRRTYS